MPNRTATTAAIILSLAAAGAPTASARPADFVPPGNQAPSGLQNRQDTASVLRSLSPQERNREAGLAAYREGQILAALAVPAPAAAPQSRFDWGDAGIGAASGLVLSVIAVGGAFAVTGRRSRRSSATAELTGDAATASGM
jgi:hypothetical protein